MKFLKACALFFFGTALTHCAPGPGPDDGSQSMLHFIPFSTTRGISLLYARESVFKVCTRGASNSQADQWSKRAVLTWLKASRQVDDRVTSEVEISCNNPHLVINMRSGNGVSFASPGNANFYTGKPFGELVHELGHALAGLSDTYVGRQAGNCKAGHPQSNMCWGAYGPRANPEAYSGLWQDDILGVQAQHRKIFPDASPPENAAAIDAEAPLDANNPWPKEGDSGQSQDANANTQQLFVAIGASTTETAKLSFSASQGVLSIVVCSNISDAQSCLNSSVKHTAQTAGEIQGRILFTTTNEIRISTYETYYAFALDVNNQMFKRQAFRFQAVN